MATHPLLSITGTQAACAKKGTVSVREVVAGVNPSKQEGGNQYKFHHWHESWTAEVNRKVGFYEVMKAVRIQLIFYHFASCALNENPISILIPGLADFTSRETTGLIEEILLT